MIKRTIAKNNRKQTRNIGDLGLNLKIMVGIAEKTNTKIAVRENSRAVGASTETVRLLMRKLYTLGLIQRESGSRPSPTSQAPVWPN